MDADPPASAADPRIRLVEEHVLAGREHSLERVVRTRCREPRLDEEGWPGASHEPDTTRGGSIAVLMPPFVVPRVYARRLSSRSRRNAPAAGAPRRGGRA